jgi:hypothetical protein
MTDTDDGGSRLKCEHRHDDAAEAAQLAAKDVVVVVVVVVVVHGPWQVARAIPLYQR